jgi:hypothetical protein
MNYMNIALSLVVGGGIGFFASTLKSPDISENNQCYKSESKSSKSPVFMFDGKTYFMSDLPLPVQLDLLKKSQSTYEQSAKAIEKKRESAYLIIAFRHLRKFLATIGFPRVR